MKYKDGLRNLREMNVAGGPGGMFGYGGAGGGIGAHGGAVGNTDFYAPGDSRVPKILGMGTTKSSGKKGKKGKKNSKIPVYRRAFIETMAVESVEKDYTLNCMLYTEVEDYQQVIGDLLETHNIPYATDENCVILEGTDDYIQSVLSKIQGIITTEPFENGDIVALVGEMDELSPEDFKGLSYNVSLDDIAKKFNTDIDILQKELESGIKVEMEHTPNRELAKKIAMDHITEFGAGYYPSLSKMESALKQKK